ncbi:calcium-binding protein [Roseibium sp. AS2]|uniref:calcium-binding protein n=1 Tax=Roseibium sp. AS2 TaxID=3135781 RepID=UPI003172E5CF
MVLADGSEAEVTSERIVYSAATADMFEQAEGYVTPENGNLALKPVYKKGWKTYNFEVEDFHTYVAGGVRVHNDSWTDRQGFDFGPHTEFDGQVWTSSYGQVDKDGNPTLASLDGRALSVDVKDVTDYLTDLDPGYRDSRYGRAEAAGYATAKAGYDNASVRAAVVAEYMARGGGNESPIDIIFQDRAHRNATAAASGADQNSGRDPEGARVDTSQSRTTGQGSGGLGDYDNNGVVSAKEFRRAEQEELYDNKKTKKSSGESDTSTKPVLLDLDGDGLEVTALDRSTVFLDTGGDGFLHRTAWAGEGDGVLYFDPDGRNEITEKRQFVFTEWDPTSTSDLEALASVFDSNGDGVLNAGDADFGKFKVLVTNADGSTTSKTLAELGITEIDLTADASQIELSDGSVITGKTTFTRSDGTTGTVGDMLLASEAEGHRVTQVESIDGTGARTVTITAYATDGGKAYEIHSVTSADGLSIVTRYDDDGDGTVDRIQTIETVVNGDGSRTETESNLSGSDQASAILTSREVTTKSADHKVEIIERDSTGGGWFDQRETRTEAADGSLTIVISDLAKDGTVIMGRSESVSSDGSSRVDGLDADGDEAADTIETHTVETHADDSRTEVVTVANQDGSLRSHVTEEVSSDNRSKVITRDLDGDGDADVREILDITVPASGPSTSTLEIRNGDGSLRSLSTTVQSEDALEKTTELDQDGDGDIDLTTVDATLVNADGSRERVVTETNGDGSVRAMRKETLDADKVGQEVWVDLDQNGSFAADELLSSVTVDAATQARTATSWTRTADGTVTAKTVTVTSADGLDRQTAQDLDGDGDTDVSVGDVTVQNGDGSSSRTVTTRNQDNTLRTIVVSETSADGLTRTTREDVDGDSVFEKKTVNTLELEADGGTTQTASAYAGDETTLLSQTVTTESADRRTTTVTTDLDGDGAIDSTSVQVKGTDGVVTRTTTQTAADGTVLGETVSTASANGLVTSIASDLDGDQAADEVSHSITTLNADGSRTTVRATENADGSHQSTSTVTVSDDGLKTVTQTDSDGNGTFERTGTDETVVNADGGTTRTVETRSQTGQLLGRTQIETSDDGLVTVQKTDRDGDGSFDLVETSTMVLEADGDTVTTTETREGGVLRGSTTRTVSDNGRSDVTESDVNGDGQTDIRITRMVADSGLATTRVQHKDETGALTQQTETVTSANGLSSTVSRDADGNGIYETRTETVRVLNADGTATTSTSFKGNDGTLQGKAVETVSGDGLTTTRTEDLDGDGLTDETAERRTAIAADGTVTTSETLTARDGSLLARSVETVSGDGRSSSLAIDADGNGTNDTVTTTTVGDDGVTTTTASAYSASGTLISRTTVAESGNGLERTVSFDLDGNSASERVLKNTTEIAADGTISRTVTHETGSGSVIAKERNETSSNGLDSLVELDLDGDGTNEFVTTSTTHLSDNGSIAETWTTVNGSGASLGSANRTTSADGLLITTETDLNGDDGIDRLRTHEQGAAGGSTETDQTFAPNGRLLRDVTVVVSEDARLQTMTYDHDGKSGSDLEIETLYDLSGDETTTYTDLRADGSNASVITKTATSNGLAAIYSLDVDGNGKTDITRETTISYNDAGDEIRLFEERDGDGTLIYASTTVTAANGFIATTSVDSDGDGEEDTNGISETVLGADGGRTTTSADWHDDGSLRSKYVETVSADGRTVTDTYDFDGDGQSDLLRVSETAADGSKTLTETGYDGSGSVHKTSTTKTTADGLLTTVQRDGVTQTIAHSPIGNGSYSWDNGVTASTTAAHFNVSHQVDGQGIETWKMVSTLDGATTIFTGRFDASAKDRLLAEAGRVYDSVLDRDMDRSEVEVLVQYTRGGQLDLAGLAEALLLSDEYLQRYNYLSDTGFVARAYQNTFGREPTVEELGEHLAFLAQPEGSRAKVIAELVRSGEHLVVGTGHGETNNHDVFLLPVTAEDELLASFGEQAVIISTDDANLLVGSAANDDLLSSGDGHDALFGGAGSDTLTGTNNNDRLIGGAGYDTLRGKFGDDELIGGTQNDMLEGGGGDDIYVYHRGDGDDIILETSHGSHGDAILFGLGIDLEDLKFSQSGDDLLIEFYGETVEEAAEAAGLGLAPLTGTITVTDWFIDPDKRVERLMFEDGGSLSIGHIDQFRPLGDIDDDMTGVSGDEYTFARGGDDIVRGAAGDDVLLGGSGNDTLLGESGDDVLLGGIGSDRLEGGSGDDTYIYNRGDGYDTIVETGSGSNGDTLFFGAGIDLEDLKLSQSGDDLLIEFYGESAQEEAEATEAGLAPLIGLVNINDWFIGTASRVERFTFENGDSFWIGHIDQFRPFSDVNDTKTGYTESEFSIGRGGDDTIHGADGHDVIVGGDGDDKLYGDDDRDILLGGDGTDQLYGGSGDDFLNAGASTSWQYMYGYSGDDTYLFEREIGKTFINGSAEVSDGGTDKVVFDGLTMADLEISIRDNASSYSNGDELQIYWRNEDRIVEGVVRVAHVGKFIEQFVFADGTSLSTFDVHSNGALKIYGEATDDSILGSAADDMIYGNDGNDTLLGGDGTDQLYGGDGNDILDSGSGTSWQYLLGQGGDDTYKFSRDAGKNYINAAAEGSGDGTDKIVFKELALRDLEISYRDNASSYVNGDELEFVWRDVNGTVEGNIRVAHVAQYIEEFEFADGTSVADIGFHSSGALELIGGVDDNLIAGSSSDDMIYGNEGDDVLLGGAGTDQLFGGNGDDLLDAGTGTSWQYLYGNEGSDTYRFSSGFSKTYINTYAESADNETDRIIFSDLFLADLEFSIRDNDVSYVNGNELEIIWRDAQGSIEGTLLIAHLGENIEQFEFADGTILSDVGSLAHGATLLNGTSADDILTSTTGVEVLTGGAGDDTFVFTSLNSQTPPQFTAADVVTDFVVGAETKDVLELSLTHFTDFDDVLARATEDAAAGSVTINVGLDAPLVVLEGVELADLHQDDFRFV